MTLILMVLAAGAEAPGSIEISGAVIQIIAFVLGMCGSIYLAAILWTKGNKGSESWKQLSVAMALFGFWNILMIFNIMMTALYNQKDEATQEFYRIIIFTIMTLDPIIEVIVFVILFSGLRTIIKKMRHKPWVLFSKVDSDE